jgi:tetratricopeptide (TPR) repeat protein
MKHVLMAWILLAGPLVHADERPPDSLLTYANSLYADRKYGEAIQVYRQIMDGGYESAALYFNAANASYRLKSLGHAVYYYEKAARLDPWDEDITYNLHLTRLQLKDKILEMPQYAVGQFARGIVVRFPFAIVVTVALIGWYGWLGAMLIPRTMGDGPVWQKTVRWASLGMFLLCAVLMTADALLETFKPEGIVLEKVVDVKNEPDANGASAFVLHEGARVEIRSHLGEWLEIRLSDGKIGWLQQKEIGRL